MSPSPITARRAWRDSDQAEVDAVIQFSHLALREENLAHGRAVGTSAD